MRKPRPKKQPAMSRREVKAHALHAAATLVDEAGRSTAIFEESYTETADINLLRAELRRIAQKMFEKAAELGCE